MRANVRLLHQDLPNYFMEKRARLNQYSGELARCTDREQYFWEMAGLVAFLFLLAASVLVLVCA